MILVRRQELRQQQEHRGHHTLGGFIKIFILTAALLVFRRDDAVCQNVDQILRFAIRLNAVLTERFVHIAVDKRHQVVAIRACRVSQVYHRDAIAIVFLRHRTVVAGEISLCVSSKEAHAAGAGVLQIRVQEVGGLAHAGRADHKTVDVIAVHQRRDAAFSAVPAAQHQALGFRQVLARPPVGYLEWYQRVAAANLLLRGPSGRTMLAIAYGSGFDVVEVIIIRQQRQCDEDCHHRAARRQQNPEVSGHVDTSCAIKSSFQSFCTGSSRMAEIPSAWR